MVLKVKYTGKQKTFTDFKETEKLAERLNDIMDSEEAKTIRYRIDLEKRSKREYASKIGTKEIPVNR